MDINKFVRNFEDAIDNVDENTLSGESKFQEIAEWDSLALLSTLAMLDSEYNVSLSGEEIKSCSTLQQLFDLTISKK
jgi:acyl carrier protein